MCEDIPLRVTEDAAKQALGNLKNIFVDQCDKHLLV